MDNPTRSGEHTIPSHRTCLCDLARGESGVVLGLERGRAAAGRLMALGFTPGAMVSVVRNAGNGPLIVTVLDTLIALGRGQACRVQVRRQD